MLRAKPSREVRIDCRHHGWWAVDGVTVTVLNADKRIGTYVFATAARNDGGPARTVVTAVIRPLGVMEFCLNALQRGLASEVASRLDSPIRPTKTYFMRVRARYRAVLYFL
jgi:hypothetical protein